MQLNFRTTNYLKFNDKLILLVDCLMVQGKGHYVISFRSSDELRTALLAGGSISVLLGTGFGAFAAV